MVGTNILWEAWICIKMHPASGLPTKESRSEHARVVRAGNGRTEANNISDEEV